MVNSKDIKIKNENITRNTNSLAFESGYLYHWTKKMMSSIFILKKIIKQKR